MGSEVVGGVLAKYVHLESIPADWREWGVNAANASQMGADGGRWEDFRLK